MIDPQKKASYDSQLRQKTQSRYSTGQTNQQFYQEYKQEQRKHEQNRRAQQQQQRRSDEEDLQRQREYQQRYQRDENAEEQARRESYEQRYQQFQQQFDDMLSNMRRKQQASYTKKENSRAQEEYFRHSSNIRGSAYQNAVYGNLAVSASIILFLELSVLF